MRGLRRLLGTQAKVAAGVGLSPATVSRVLDREGHKKHRVDMQARRRVSTLPNVETPEPDKPVETNVVKLRRRRPDRQPKEPRRAETHKCYEQYRGGP